MSRVRTCLAYAAEAEDAARLYVSLVPGSEITEIVRNSQDAPPVVVNFTLGGAPFQALNAGADFGHTMGASVSLATKDQAETDRVWAALLEGGGREHRCGWLSDRWGVAWQVVPDAMIRAFTSPDREAAARAHEAMLKMVKIDVAAIEAAVAGR